MKVFCSSYRLKSLIKQPTCCKNPCCIDLILTNKPENFQSTCVIETGLSDFYRMTPSVLKMHFRKLPPKVISYREFKKFENERFMDSLYLALNSQNIDYTRNPDLFFNICQNELNHHAPRKKKTSAGIMNLSWLKHCLHLSWKERVLETDFWKIRQMKID